MTTYVGLSLSFCVAAVLRGEVTEDQIAAIVSSTSCRTTNDWDGVIDSYRSSYWSQDPDTGEQAARALINSGRILQPRLGQSLGDYAQHIKLMQGGVVALGEMGTNWIDANTGASVTF
jgi:hypothetical protein